MGANNFPVAISPDRVDFVYPVKNLYTLNVNSAGAGIAVQAINTGTYCRGAMVRAIAGNVAVIYLGGLLVTQGNGFEMSPGDVVSIGLSDLSNLWIVFSSDGDAARILYGT